MKYLFTILWIICASTLMVSQSPFEEIIKTEGALSDQDAKTLLGDSIAFRPYSFSIKRLDINRPGIWLNIAASNGVCLETWIYHFDAFGNIVSRKMYAEACDHDGSNPSYSRLEGQILYPEPIIEMITINKRVIDTIYLEKNGYHFKDGYSFHDADMEFETEILYECFGINEKGALYKICEDSTSRNYRKYPFSYFRLLKESDLKSYDRDELRIMRNEIFADYGYTFRSEELSKYFHSQSWYLPNNKSVEAITKEMNVIEKRNVQLIRKVEQRLKK